MNVTTTLIVNAALGLVAGLSVFAVVRFLHRLHQHDHRAETVLPSQPIAITLALTHDEVEDLAEAA
jgi:hypothetical protein